MPRYEVVLESPDTFRPDGSPHFRVTRLDAPDADEAQRLCTRSEYAQCAFTLAPEELDRIEAVEADPGQKLAGQDKGRLFAHRQDQPYQVISVTEVTPPAAPAGRKKKES